MRQWRFVLLADRGSLPVDAVVLFDLHSDVRGDRFRTSAWNLLPGMLSPAHVVTRRRFGLPIHLHPPRTDRQSAVNSKQGKAKKLSKATDGRMPTVFLTIT